MAAASLEERALGIPVHPSRDDAESHPVAVSLVLFGLAAAGWLALLVWATSGYFMDDAYIGFACVQNLIDGRGLVLTPGVRIEGVTNAGWLLVLAPLGHAFPIPLVARALATGLAVATALGAARLAYVAARSDPERQVPAGAAAGACGLLVITHFDFVYFALSGMEPALAAGLLTCAALQAFRLGAAGGTASTAIGLFAALAFAVRPDAAVVFPLFACLALLRRAVPLGTLARGGIVFGLGVAAVTAARMAYFGDVVPNTFHAKPSGSSVLGVNLVRFLLGDSTNLPFPFAGLLVLPVFALGFSRLSRVSPPLAAWTAAVALGGALFGVYSRADWTGLGRYFAPYAPLAFPLFGAGLLEVERRVRDVWTRRGGPAWRPGFVSAVLVGAIAVAGIGKAALTLSPSSTGTFPGYILTSARLVEPSRWLAAHLPPGSVVATRRIGALAYYSQFDLFDYKFGLAEREVAQRVRAAGRFFDDPNDAVLRDLWLDRRPDYLLEDADVIGRIAAASGGTPESFHVHGLGYRVAHRFPIGDGVDWVLAERTARSTGN